MVYDFQKRSDDAGLVFSDPSLTRQEFVSQCNVNNVIKKYVKNGNMSSLVITQDAKYGDFTDVPSHQDALNLVCAAQDYFDQLPASTRSRFDNDPGKLLDFLGDTANREEAIKLGLVKTDQILNSNSENKNFSPEAKSTSAEGTSSS